MIIDVKRSFRLEMLFLTLFCINCSNKEPKPETRVSFYPGDSLLKHIISFNKLGQQNGIYISFTPEGSINRIEQYINGKLDGQRFVFHENGIIKTIESYSNGNKNGIFYGFYPTGKMHFQMSWKNNIKSNQLTEYSLRSDSAIVINYDSLGKRISK